jgi:predicted nucleic acid-binding protein
MRDIYHSNNISVVVDNNVLVDLFELGCLNLLFQVFDNVMIPQILYASEVQDNAKFQF